MTPDQIAEGKRLFTEASNDVDPTPAYAWEEWLDRNADALLAAAEQVETLKASWRCFHCGDVFTDKDEAREHFGCLGRS